MKIGKQHYFDYPKWNEMKMKKSRSSLKESGTKKKYPCFLGGHKKRSSLKESGMSSLLPWRTWRRWTTFKSARRLKIDKLLYFDFPKWSGRLKNPDRLWRSQERPHSFLGGHGWDRPLLSKLGCWKLAHSFILTIQIDPEDKKSRSSLKESGTSYYLSLRTWRRRTTSK